MKKMSLTQIAKATNVSVATLRFWSNHYEDGEVHSKDHFNTQHIMKKLSMIENITTLLEVKDLSEIEIVRSAERTKKVLELTIGEKYLLGYGDNTKTVEITDILSSEWTDYVEYVEDVDDQRKFNITTKTAFLRTARGAENE